MQRTSYVIACILLFVWCLVSNASASPSLILLTDERPPFEYSDPDGRPAGVAVEIVRCALEKTGLPFEIKITSWKRAQLETQKGKAAGFFSASHNVDRDKYAELSGIVVDQYWSWYVSGGSSLNPESEYFRVNARTASWLGSNSLKWLKSNGYKIKSNPSNVDQLLLQLSRGKIDAAFGSDVAFDDAINRLGLGGRFKSTRGVHKPMGVYFSHLYLKSKPGFLVRFNQFIIECAVK